MHHRISFFQNNVKCVSHLCSPPLQQHLIAGSSGWGLPLCTPHELYSWPPSSPPRDPKFREDTSLCLHRRIPTESRTREWPHHPLTIQSPLGFVECSRTPAVWYNGAPGAEAGRHDPTSSQLRTEVLEADVTGPHSGNQWIRDPSQTMMVCLQSSTPDLDE